MTDQTLTPTLTRDAIDDAALTEIVQNVWSTLLGSPATPTDARDVSATTVSISISGAWNATVTMTMDQPAVGAFAAQLFGMEVDELDDELKADAIGEIVNVVGGNVKSQLDTDPPTALSLPIVSLGVPDIVGATIASEVGFDADGHHFVWRIHTSSR